MKAKLYLERINQEMINKTDVSKIVKQIDKALGQLKGDGADWGGNVWDKSCCIINCHKDDPDIYEMQEIGEFITMRREKFGGLVWVRRTNAVFQVDEQAFMVLTDLDNGVSVKQAAKTANVKETSIRTVLAQLKKTPASAATSRV